MKKETVEINGKSFVYYIDFGNRSIKYGTPENWHNVYRLPHETTTEAIDRDYFLLHASEAHAPRPHGAIDRNNRSQNMPSISLNELIFLYEEKGNIIMYFPPEKDKIRTVERKDKETVPQAIQRDYFR